AKAGDTAQSYFDVRKRMTPVVPVLTVHANVSGWDASHTSAHLGAYATFSGAGGDSSLTYSWSTVAAPAGASPVITGNSSLAARDCGVRFDVAGDYTFVVSISDGHTTINSSVTLTVAAVISSIVVTP